MIAPISKEDARLCAGVVREVAAAKGLTRDPSAIGRPTVTLARLFNRGLRDRDQLLVAAMDQEWAAWTSDRAPAVPPSDQAFSSLALEWAALGRAETKFRLPVPKSSFGSLICDEAGRVRYHGYSEAEALAPDPLTGVFNRKAFEEEAGTSGQADFQRSLKRQTVLLFIALSSMARPWSWRISAGRISGHWVARRTSRQGGVSQFDLLRFRSHVFRRA